MRNNHALRTGLNPGQFLTNDGDEDEDLFLMKTSVSLESTNSRM